MSVNVESRSVKVSHRLRGFTNLYEKEHRAWWRTHRWWINALIWTLVLAGLSAIMLFAAGEEVRDATADEIAQAGGELAYIITLGLNAFFEFGVPMLAIGTIILTQDLIIGERQNGVAEWLLSKPVTRWAYVLAKLAANTAAVLLLLIALPAAIVYGLLSVRLGALFPWLPFLSGVGMMALHTVFYLTFTVMLGTIFNTRGPILGTALASVLGGGLLGKLLNPLLYVTPWMLPKLAFVTAASQPIPTTMAVTAPAATALWILVFVAVALHRVDRMEC
jgi:ABC-2 type transport system permease protein